MDRLLLVRISEHSIFQQKEEMESVESYPTSKVGILGA